MYVCTRSGDFYMADKIGRVYLVGAGPGDPGLITVRGRDLLQNAQVVIYDYLAAPALLQLVPQSAEKIYVGKKGGDHTLSQDGINALIVEKARTGKNVVRLKGGDPFVFGRGGEEAEVLRENNIEFEVVPGVTSAVAAPAYAGIPVTHRGLTSTVCLVTGHEDPFKPDSDIDWPALARGIGTLIFFMGVKNLPVITSRLLENGRSPETPVALVRWGTTSFQKTVTGTLSNIVDKVRAAGLKPPAIIVVGEVVGLREKLSWFENRPLLGKTIVVTRAREQASNLVDSLAQMGANCISVPCIQVAEPEDDASRRQLEQAIEGIQAYQWIVFTSVNGVNFFFDKLEKAGKDTRVLAHAKFACIGPATAEKLKSHGITADVIPDTYRAESVAAAFENLDINQKRVLLPRARAARPVLPQELRKMGAKVDEIPVYDTQAVAHDPQGLIQDLKSGNIHMVTFTSSSTVKNFAALLPKNQIPDLMAQTAVACIGPITADTAKDLGFTVALTADTYTIPGLCEAICKYFKEKA